MEFYGILEEFLEQKVSAKVLAIHGTKESKCSKYHTKAFKIVFK
jgi:hypothetical protein